MIDIDRIHAIVHEHLEQSLLNLDKESLKFDFKYEWYNLTTLKGINEYLKDTTAMANTYGLDGFIVMGFDERRKIFKEARFEDCGLKDTNELNKVIIKRVSHLFELNSYDIMIDGHALSVLHIPPAWEKPFFIRNYQTFTKQQKVKKEYHQKVFVRKNTGTFSATKYDIDLMYYDRKNIEPDYRVFMNIFKVSILPLERIINIKFTVENAGKRPIAIVDYSLISGLSKNKECECPAAKIWGENGSYTPNHSSEIVQASHIKNFSVEFAIPENNTEEVMSAIKEPKVKKQLLLKLSNNKVILQDFKYST